MVTLLFLACKWMDEWIKNSNFLDLIFVLFFVLYPHFIYPLASFLPYFFFFKKKRESKKLLPNIILEFEILWILEIISTFFSSFFLFWLLFMGWIMNEHSCPWIFCLICFSMKESSFCVFLFLFLLLVLFFSCVFMGGASSLPSWNNP